jgi:hypothetical protein
MKSMCEEIQKIIQNHFAQHEVTFHPIERNRHVHRRGQIINSLKIYVKLPDTFNILLFEVIFFGSRILGLLHERKAATTLLRFKQETRYSTFKASEQTLNAS